MHHAHIDKFAYQDSPIHRLDSRVKFIITVIFTVMVIALPRTSISILFCYAIGPFAVLVIGKIPLRFVFRHILIVSPFVLVLAFSSPWYDRTPVDVLFGPFVWQMTTGWLRFGAIIGKFIVTMMTLIALVSTTKFSDLLKGLQKLYFPQVLIIQLGFLYRYIFVLIDKAHHIIRARASRRLRNLGFQNELKVTASMIGSLFVRSIDTAENINHAMQGRGFDGNWRTLTKLQIRGGDYIFMSLAAIFMFVLYFFIQPFVGGKF